MSGLYVHIPFCESRCIYCDFFSSMALIHKERYVDMLCKEIELRSDYIPSEHLPIDTVYLGGGTPSQLSPQQLEKIFVSIDRNLAHAPWESMEVTMECNPDDIAESNDLLHVIRQLPINRVSMGAQTFDDERLKFLQRRHHAAQVYKAVELLRRNNIDNISIDLMFGFPNESESAWEKDVEKALSLQATHYSAYSLMIEEDTPLGRMVNAGKVVPNDEENCRRMYYTLIDMMSDAGFEHYEISNFAKKGFRSRHNSSYWQAKPYLGVGAAAHSFNLKSRQWNVSNLSKYMNSIAQNLIPCEVEYLDERTIYNDVITTALRTVEGICVDELKKSQQEYLMAQAKKHLTHGMLAFDGHNLHLTKAGLYVSDDIMSDLIML